MSSETVRRLADGGRLRVSRDGSGNRVIDGIGLAFAKERGAGTYAVPEDDLPAPVRNSFVGIVTAGRGHGDSTGEVDERPYRPALTIRPSAAEQRRPQVQLVVEAGQVTSRAHARPSSFPPYDLAFAMDSPTE
ncbi:MerR family transcriptional regulator [Streptomyces flavidovirens]|uniref:MerR family transcriptional regulator n=1 Tax=Streptomyces flavidovirens TaxID=67298 RepID=UPI001FCB48A0|nr:MerR family transcriptional regulator [Streptomyces flavidovirens]